MGSLGYIVGGLLQGVGQGMAVQEQQRASERVQTALENLRSQNRREEAGIDHGYKMEQIQTTADVNDRNDARSVQRNTTSRVAIEKVQAANQQSLARLQSSLRLNETQQEAALDLSNKLTLAGQEVGDYKVAADGSLVALSKTGKVLMKTRPGRFIPDGMSMSGGDSGTGTIAQASAARGGSGGIATASPQQQPQAQPRGNQQQPDKTFTAAEVSATAKQLGWSEDEVRRWAAANGWKMAK